MVKHDSEGNGSLHLGPFRFTGDVNIGQIVGWGSALVSLLIFGIRSFDKIENTINSNSATTNSQIALLERQIKFNEDVAKVKLDAVRTQLMLNEQELARIRDRLAQMQGTRRTE